MTAPKLLFFVTEDWYFCSHRLGLARRARAAGFEVTVVTRVQSHGQAILDAGCRLVPIDLDRRGKNLFREVSLLRSLVRVYRSERPDLVHHVALKPVIYGSLAARLTGIRGVVNALPGLGYLFTSRRWTASLLRTFAVAAYRVLLNARNCRLIVQNPDDLATLVRHRAIASERAVLIRGSGVDPEVFRPAPEPQGIPLVVLPARMLWDKGVREFVDAARALKVDGIAARFALVGDTDEHNPEAISTEALREWHRSGVVEWWGRRDDMPRVYAEASLVCLPSYREGLPKALIEAASAGRAIVATDVPGCREIVRHEVNGLLVPPRDARALADAVRNLLGNADRRARLGKAGRSMVEKEFTESRVAQETFNVYRDLLPSGFTAKERDGAVSKGAEGH